MKKQVILALLTKAVRGDCSNALSVSSTPFPTLLYYGTLSGTEDCGYNCYYYEDFDMTKYITNTDWSNCPLSDCYLGKTCTTDQYSYAYMSISTSPTARLRVKTPTYWDKTFCLYCKTAAMSSYLTVQSTLEIGVDSCDGSRGVSFTNANLVDKSYTVTTTSTIETVIVGTNYYKFLSGCNFASLSFSIIKADGSAYNDSPSKISIHSQTGTVTYDRQYSINQGFKIKIVTNGSNIYRTSAFNIVCSCTADSTEITNPNSALIVQSQTYSIDGNQPYYTFGEMGSSNS